MRSAARAMGSVTGSLLEDHVLLERTGASWSKGLFVFLLKNL